MTSLHRAEPSSRHSASDTCYQTLRRDDARRNGHGESTINRVGRQAARPLLRRAA
jgi:hypothetical protein